MGLFLYAFLHPDVNNLLQGVKGISFSIKIFGSTVMGHGIGRRKKINCSVSYHENSPFFRSTCWFITYIFQQSTAFMRLSAKGTPSLVPWTGLRKVLNPPVDMGAGT